MLKHDFNHGGKMQDFNNNNNNKSGLNPFLNYVKKLNEKTKQTFNNDKAKKIRRNLIAWGIVACILGAVLFCFSVYQFMTSPAEIAGKGGASFGDFENAMGTSLLYMGLMVLASLIISLGGMMVKAGLAVWLVGVGSEFVDVRKKCPKCGDLVDENEKFCSKCGEPLMVKKVCASCGAQNEFEDEFCRGCGKRLDK